MKTRQAYVKDYIEHIDNPPTIHCQECGQEIEVVYDLGKYRATPCCPPEAIVDQLHDATWGADTAGDKADILFPYIVKQMVAMMETLGDTALKDMIDAIEFDLDEIKHYIDEAATVGE